MVVSRAITLIMPVYNGMPFIQEAISSLIEQDFSNWKILIGDNCSTDGTRDYLRSLNDARIQVFLHEENKGIFGNLNFLFTNSYSEFSHILCSDDYFLNTTSLYYMVDTLYKSNKYESIFRFNYVCGGGEFLNSYQQKITPVIIEANKSDMFFYVFGNLLGNLSNVSVRTSVIKDSGWFDEKLPYAGDFEFWQRAAKKTSIKIIKKLVIFIRRHENVASNYLNKNGELMSQRAVIFNLLFQRLSISSYQRFLLKFHGTICYDTSERDLAMKYIITKGEFWYLKKYNKLVSKCNYVFTPLISWLIYFVSIGGRVGRDFSSKVLIRFYLKYP